MPQVNRNFSDWTNEDFLQVLRDYGARNGGKAPFGSLFNNSDLYPGVTSYKTRFGSWTNALKLAGLDPNPKTTAQNNSANKISFSGSKNWRDRK